MYLNDLQIRRLIKFEGLTSPNWEYLINPASLDLTIGENALELIPQFSPIEERLIKQDEVGNRFFPRKLSQESKIAPSRFILLETEQVFHFPDNVTGMIRLKSSRGRQAYEHLEAGWIDPGFEGKLTLEIINHAYIPLPIYPGMRIAQIIFGWIDPPNKLYSGRYQGDQSVQIAKREKTV